MGYMEDNNMKKNFGIVVCDNLTDEEYELLRKMKRKHVADKYKIIITCERKDYDDLMHYGNHPEEGTSVGTFYFHNPDQLDLIVKAFEGLFYQMFVIGETERFGGGIVDDLIYEDWWNEGCCQVCECCFLRGGRKMKRDGISYYMCRKHLITD